MHVCMNRPAHTEVITEDRYYQIRKVKFLHSSFPPTFCFCVTVYRGKYLSLVKHGGFISFTFHYSKAAKEL